jgi:hypothetical protein
VEAVLNNVQLNDNINYKFTEWETSYQDAKMIGRDAALKIALPQLQNMAARADNANNVSNINIVLLKFSDLVMPIVPETGFSLTEIPVWLVTVEKIEFVRHGPGKGTTPGVVHVIIDAYGGEEILQCVHGIGE